jgi:hypothetical protein
MNQVNEVYPKLLRELQEAVKTLTTEVAKLERKDLMQTLQIKSLNAESMYDLILCTC